MSKRVYLFLAGETVFLTGVDMGGGINRLSRSALEDAETVFEASYIIIILVLFNNYQVLEERVKSEYSLVENNKALYEG